MLSVILACIAFYLIATSWRAMKDAATMVIRCHYGLNHLPGPPALPFFGIILSMKWDIADLFVQIMDWAYEYIYNKSGLGIAWLGPIPMVFILAPEYVKTVLESNTLIDKSSFYAKLKDWLGPDSILLSSGDKWRSHRKMLTPAFHFKVLQGFTNIFNRQAEVFLDQLSVHADTDREVDIFPYVQHCALDIICETSMGVQINAQLGHNSDYVDAVDKIMQYTFKHILSPWLWPKPLWYASGIGFEFDRLVKLTKDFSTKIIAERRATLKEEFVLDDIEELSKKKYVPFIDVLLLAQETRQLSDEDIRQQVDTFMFGGHDTVSTVLGSALWLLGQHPECQAKVQAEIDQAIGDATSDVTEADFKNLLYLEKCIKESLRLYPPAPLLARDFSHDVTLGDTTIPKNTPVAIPPYGTHRDPQHWERPEEFYPEHFDLEAVIHRHPFAYYPFSGGPRNCIGQKFAMIEMKILLALFFRQYTVESVEPRPGNRFRPEIILKPEKGFLVRIFRRKQEPII